MAKRKVTKQRKTPIMGKRQRRKSGDPEQDLAQAVQYFQAGRVKETQLLCRDVLIAVPDHPVALHLLGVIARQAGEFDEAVGLLLRAVTAAPQYAAAFNDLGSAYFDLENFAEAASAHEQAIALEPGNIGALMNLGNARRAEGALDDAIIYYRKALAIEPRLAGAHVNIGVVRRDQSALDDAVQSFYQAIELDPKLVQAHANLGLVLYRQQKWQQCAEALADALTLNPNDANVGYHLGSCYKHLGRLEEAVETYREVVKIQPDNPAAYNNLGYLLNDLNRLEEAVDAYEAALAADPTFADALSNLGNACREQGQLDEATQYYEQALEVQPAFSKAHSNMLLTAHARTDHSAAAILALHKNWDARHGAPLRAAWHAHDNSRDPERRLKVGLVSADLGAHPVGYFTIGFVEHRESEEIELSCYCSRPSDAMTARFVAAADHWIDTRDMSDEDLAARVREDRIDVLFDLSGHTTNDRLMTFARKPAPVQISWSGYPGTTGLAAMDYLISDPHHTGDDDDVCHVEKLIRLPDSFICYAPPEDTPAVGPLPYQENGFITFGCFSNPAKINEVLLARWANIMSEVPESRLVMKYQHLDAATNQHRIRGFLEARGIDGNRIDIAGRQMPQELMAAYNDIDIALDTYPYSGGATTCEALWMGVPVLTVPGGTFASRHAFSLLSGAGLKEFIADDEDELIAMTIALANDPETLAELRAGLRGRLSISPLCDVQRFTANLGAAIRDAWRAWCAQY
jgi:protein O-GlcNAc transferase